MRLSNAVDFTFPLGTVVAPGERVLVVNDTALFDATYRTINSPYYHSGIRVAGAWTGSLNNGGETISLHHPTDLPMFDVSYADNGLWPGRPDGRGSSLELIDPAAVPINSAASRSAWLSDPQRWRATSEYHGTPGWAGTGPDNRMVINEVLTASIPPASDAIELLNTSAISISIGGWFLSDDADNYKKFRLPAGTTVVPGSYLVLARG